MKTLKQIYHKAVKALLEFTAMWLGLTIIILPFFYGGYGNPLKDLLLALLAFNMPTISISIILTVIDMGINKKEWE